MQLHTSEGKHAPLGRRTRVTVHLAQTMGMTPAQLLVAWETFVLPKVKDVLKKHRKKFDVAGGRRAPTSRRSQQHHAPARLPAAHARPAQATRRSVEPLDRRLPYNKLRAVRRQPDATSRRGQDHVLLIKNLETRVGPPLELACE